MAVARAGVARGAAFTLLMLTAGCGPSIWRNAPAVQEAAGLIARLDAAACRVRGGDALDVGLAREPEPGAWAWPDGWVRVSAALAGVLDDDELAAALAHELGHLRRGGTPAAVGGAAGASDAERDADRIGCAILAERGVPPAAMVSMLRTLARTAKLDLSARIDAAVRACALAR